VRFYFDADVLGLAHVVAGLRSDAAVETSNARMVALAGDDARGTWQQLEILMRQCAPSRISHCGCGRSSTALHARPSEP